jgi:hypothetical protein
MRATMQSVSLSLAVLWLCISLISCVAPGVELYPDFTATGIADNPYDEVDWAAASCYDANFHTHTTLSDGELDPHEVVDLYVSEGYEILALSDHDSHHDDDFPDTLYPWDRFSEIGSIVGEDDWEDRDPDMLGMVALESSEVSRAHHMNTFFMGYAGGHSDEQSILSSVETAEGVAVLNHPGRYNKSVSWYVDLFDNYNRLIGIEIFNRDDRYPRDRLLWDAILYQMMPGRPVWGFGNDDMHIAEHVGYNRNVIILSALNTEEVKRSMVNGEFYLFRPESRGDKPDTVISSIRNDQSSITIMLDNPSDARISWITYDPLAKSSTTITTGSTFTVGDMTFASPYVRAEIRTSAGVIYTQPFALELSRNL